MFLYLIAVAAGVCASTALVVALKTLRGSTPGTPGGTQGEDEAARAARTDREQPVAAA